MAPSLYRPSLALLTDLYQLTMACGYWRAGRADLHASFHLFFRTAPFNGSYAVACGIGPAVEWLSALAFDAEDLDYLASLRTFGGGALFPAEFLEFLGSMRLRCDVDAVAEGTVVFPHEPILRVEGPILQCQLAETALLNLVNFQTLIATKAARVCQAARGRPVLEFGLRRAQGIDGGLAASRAAWVGGCAATSNVLAGRLYGIPVRGTHAHSWVMSFDSEMEAFSAYARAMPENATFLVDTYNTLEGVRRAARVGREMRRNGHEMAGVRLDSGDLAWLSVRARRILDEEGFPEARIVASNDLDEEVIESLHSQGAAVDLYGVGTHLVTGGGQPALGGVYKLGAVRRADGSWDPRIKVSEQMAKSSVPGRLQVRRYLQPDGRFLADAIHDVERPPDDGVTIISPEDGTRRREVAPATPWRELLEPLLREGRAVQEPPPLEEVRRRVQRELSALDPTITRLKNPHTFPAGLSEELYLRREEMILKIRRAQAPTNLADEPTPEKETSF